MERILFLDIDGVLADEAYITESRTGRNVPHEETLIDARKVLLLNALEDLAVKVVISSSWGNWNGKTAELLHRLGLKLEVIGQTTHVHLKYDWACRGNEIKKWLLENVSDVKEFKYAILDDDCDMLLEQAENFVRVDRDVALTGDNVVNLRKILD